MILTKKKGEWFEILIPLEWEGQSTEALFRDIWKAPKKQTHLLRINKEVTVNGQPTNWTAPLKKNDRIQIKLFANVDFGVIPYYQEIEILYEDDHLLIVNKKRGIDTHPNTPKQTNTLLNAVAFHLQALGEQRHVKHIHRLDRDTSGVILFAKHSFGGAILDKMLEERLIKRTYVAIVHGLLKQKKGSIHAPIGRDRHHPVRRRVSPNGQTATTHYNVIETNRKKNMTIVQCQLDTGRTHQIRVHFSHIGHPLVGDTLYGGEAILPYQALHAEQLEFIHPFTREKITCIAKNTRLNDG